MVLQILNRFSDLVIVIYHQTQQPIKDGSTLLKVPRTRSGSEEQAVRLRRNPSEKWETPSVEGVKHLAPLFVELKRLLKRIIQNIYVN